MRRRRTVTEPTLITRINVTPIIDVALVLVIICSSRRRCCPWRTCP
jgi:biopolymer transport protein ExbD